MSYSQAQIFKKLQSKKAIYMTDNTNNNSFLLLKIDNNYIF